MAKFHKQSDITDEIFFGALERGATVCQAAKLTGCSRQALYRRRIRDRVFDKRWSTIEDERQRKRRRRQRSRRFSLPVFETPAGRPFSNGRLLARLKAIRPATYRER